MANQKLIEAVRKAGPNPQVEALRKAQQQYQAQGRTYTTDDLVRDNPTAANPNAYNARQATFNAPAVQQQQVVSSTGNPQNTAQSYIDQLNAARKQQVMAGLDKSRQSALMNLQGERSAVAPRYTEQRAQTAAGSQQAFRNIQEFLQARGSTRAGSAIQTEINRQGTLQNNLGSLNRQEAASYDDINRRMTGVNNAFESDVASASAGIEGDRMQSLINQFNQDRNFGLQQNQQNFNQGFQNSQFQAQQEQRGLDNQFRQNSFEYTKAMNDLDNAFKGQQFDLQKANMLWEQNFKNRSYQQGINEFASRMGLEQQQLNQRGQEFLAEMAYKDAAMELNRDQFAQDKFRADVGDAFKRREMDFVESQAQLPKAPSATEVKNKIESDYVGKIDRIPEGQLDKFFTDEKANIVKDLGLSGYETLKELYGIY